MEKIIFDTKKPISKENPKELVEERKLCSKTFDIGNGEKRFVARMTPMHYEDEKGDLQDVSTDIENNGVHKCDYDLDLLDGKVGYTGTDPKGKKVELELTGVTFKEPIIEGNKATYQEIEKDVDFVIEFTTLGIKAKRILKSATSNKVGVYRSIREEGAMGKLINLGADKEGRNTKLIMAEEETGNVSEKIITQTFDGKVMRMNKDTRKREWSDDVKYPVIIDPTSTFSIAANADDGYAKIATMDIQGNTITWHRLYQYGTTKWAGFLRFNITGISQGTTINSATLKTYIAQVGGTGASTFSIKVPATDKSDPSIPTSEFTAITPGVTHVVSNTTDMKGTSTFNDTIPSAYRITAFTPTKANFGVHNHNVQTLVQALVNAYDYTNAHMMFYYRVPTPTGFAPHLAIYDRDWGTSKDAELVIDYGEAAAGVTNNTLTTNSKYWG